MKLPHCHKKSFFFEGVSKKVTWTSQHFLGTEQCITIIDTPGIFNQFSGYNVDASNALIMQQELRDELDYIDLIVIVFKGKNTR